MGTLLDGAITRRQPRRLGVAPVKILARCDAPRERGRAVAVVDEALLQISYPCHVTPHRGAAGGVRINAPHETRRSRRIVMQGTATPPRFGEFRSSQPATGVERLTVLRRSETGVRIEVLQREAHRV